MSHIIVKSRPSDRARGRYRSCDSQSFCKKSLELYQNQPAVRPPLSGNFTKKPSTFLKINPQSTSPSLPSSPQIHATTPDDSMRRPPHSQGPVAPLLPLGARSVAQVPPHALPLVPHPPSSSPPPDRSPPHQSGRRGILAGRPPLQGPSSWPLEVWTGRSCRGVFGARPPLRDPCRPSTQANPPSSHRRHSLLC